MSMRQEWTTKGQQSFTIRFRRDKLTVIFSRIRSSQLWEWMRPSLGMRQHPPWQAQLAFGYARFGFKKQPSQTSLASLSLHPISDARGQCMLAVPSAIRGCPHFCVAKTLARTASSVRFAWECIEGGREGVASRPARSRT